MKSLMHIYTWMRELMLTHWYILIIAGAIRKPNAS